MNESIHYHKQSNLKIVMFFFIFFINFDNT